MFTLATHLVFTLILSGLFPVFATTHPFEPDNVELVSLLHNNDQRNDQGNEVDDPPFAIPCAHAVSSAPRLDANFLYNAIVCNDAATVRICLLAGVDPEAPTPSRYVALPVGTGSYPLSRFAIHRDNPEVVAAFFGSSHRLKPKVNAWDCNGLTALHYVKSLRVATLLVEHAGADINLMDRYLHATPLVYLVEHGGVFNPELAEYLINQGADVNAKDFGNNSVLHAAVNGGNPGAVSFFLTRVKNINHENSDYHTALDVALNALAQAESYRNSADQDERKLNNLRAIVQLLEDAGVRKGRCCGCSIS